MLDYLLDNNGFVTSLFEFLAALVGIIFFYKYKTSVAKYLILFLVYTAVMDLIGGYPSHLKKIDSYDLIDGTRIEQNYWWYVIFWMGGLTSFITFINYNICKKEVYKKVLKYLYLIYVVQFILYIIFNFDALFNPTEKFLKITSIWMILVAVFIYLLEVLQSDKVIEFYKSIYFYINISVFIWTIVTGPMMFFELYYSTADSNFISLKRSIYLSINILYYTTLSLALIFCKPETK